MKLGATYLITILKYGYPPKPEDDFKALTYLNKLGFHYLEMEGLGVEHANNLKRNLSTYKKALADNGIHIHNFCAVNPDLTSLDPKNALSQLIFSRKWHRSGVNLGLKLYILQAIPRQFNILDVHHIN